MKVVFLTLAAVAAVSAQYKTEPAGAPPAATAAIDPHGVRVIGSGGKVWCEVWVAKTLPAGARSTETDLSLPAIPHGAFLGVVNFPLQASDRRGNPIKAGVYAMRYSYFPTDGNHMGAAPQRDFAILIPVAQDKAPDVLLNYEALMALSRESNGTPHPSVLALAPSGEASGTPALKQEGDRDWVLHVKVGGVAVALTLVGRAEG